MAKPLAFFGALTAALMTQSGCIIVGGYSSRGGWFIWPGSIGLLLFFLLLYLLFGRRR